MARELGADSLAYLSLDGVYEAIGSSRATHCDACFTGEYPLEGTEQANGKHALEELAVARLDASSVAGADARFPIAVLVSGSGTNLQAILDTVHGRDGHRGGRPSPAASRASRRSSGRRGAGVEAAVFEAAGYPDRAARDRGDGGLARASAEPSSSCWPASWSC